MRVQMLYVLQVLVQFKWILKLKRQKNGACYQRILSLIKQYLSVMYNLHVLIVTMEYAMRKYLTIHAYKLSQL